VDLGCERGRRSTANPTRSRRGSRTSRASGARPTFECAPTSETALSSAKST
jgi:hypothetical protein